MTKHIFTAIAMAGMLGVAQERVSTGAVPVHMVVTVEAVHGKDVPELKREDVVVLQDKEPVPVTEWTALRGEQAGLELYILVDDTSAWGLGSQLADLREFIGDQPASTSIGIGYMHNGIADIVQSPTADHSKAAKALRLPFGSIAAGASPYISLSDMIKQWPASNARREVLTISSGADPLGGFGATNPYLDMAIERAQLAGVIVYAIYTPGAGHSGHSFLQMNWGQNYLARLAEETGGESHLLGFAQPVSLAPYLQDVAENLKHQYSVGFLVESLDKPALVQVRFVTAAPNAEIVAAPKVFVWPDASVSGGDR